MTDDQLETTPLYRKALGCLSGGIVGDAMGTPTENLTYRAEGIREDSSEKVGRWSAVDQRGLARNLTRAALAKYQAEGEARARFASISEPSESTSQPGGRRCSD